MYLWDGAKCMNVDLPHYINPDGTTSPVLSATGVPYGYRSISRTMASGDVFYSAHRGGSADWPEMTLHAYTQAVMAGVGMLEVSLARTSDGVWFGLHDRDLTRTSGVALNPVNATWADIQRYLVTPPAGSQDQPPRPYMRLEELLEAYGSTHTIMFDPKYATNHLGSLLTLLVSSVNPDRLVGKYYYTSTSFANACKGQHIKTWGYGYEADIPAMLDPKYAVWDSFGMDHAASQSAWDQLKALGKPIIGHICRTSQEMDTAIAKGASGLQVSGVRNIPHAYGGAHA